MIKDLPNLKLLDVLPANLLADEQVMAAAQALDTELQAVTKAVAETMHLSRLDVLPEAVIDLLAWQWHVDFYEPIGMNIETKRKLVKRSIAWHRIKGTPAAVEKMIQTVYQNGIVEEWHEYGGKPFFFRVKMENSIIASGMIKQLLQLIEVSKNVRSMLEGLIFQISCKSVLYLGSHADTFKRYDLAPKTEHGGDLLLRIKVGTADGKYKRAGLRPLLASNADVATDIKMGINGNRNKQITISQRCVSDCDPVANIEIGSSADRYAIKNLYRAVTLNAQI